MACHVETAESAARDSVPRLTRSMNRTVPSNATSTYVPSRNVQLLSWSTTPRPSAASTVTGRLVMPPTTAAVSVISSRGAPPSETLVNEAKPRMGTRNRTASAESNPVTVQMIVDSRRTGTPSS